MIGSQFRISVQLTLALTIVALIALASSTANAQSPSQPEKQSEVGTSGSVTTQPSPPVTNKPPSYSELLGVSLGMSADEVRDKLGKVKDKGDKQDFFVFSESKTAQVYYDADGKVIAFSVDYLGKSNDVPTPEIVLGEAVTPKADGSIYQLKRYPQDGYWVAYNQSAGDHPVTSITVQKAN